MTAAQAGTQGKKGHPSAHGSGNPSTGVDPGALLARLEEQKRGVIQDEQQHKAITEEQEASGDPQRRKDPCHNLGQAQKLDGTSAAVRATSTTPRQAGRTPHQVQTASEEQERGHQCRQLTRAPPRRTAVPHRAPT